MNNNTNGIINLHPSTERVISPIPKRLTYAKLPEKITEEKQISKGGWLADNLSIHWDSNAKNTSLKIDEPTEWKLAFSSKPGKYISFSWSLLAKDLDFLSSNQMVSFGFSYLGTKVQPLANPKIHGRMTAIKGKKTLTIARDGGYFDGRYQVSFLPERDGIPYDSAMRVWIDFMIVDPKFQYLTLHDPMIWYQEAARI